MSGLAMSGELWPMLGVAASRPLAWVAVVLYLVVAATCLSAGRGVEASRVAAFWRISVAVLLVIAISKGLGLEELVTDAGREISRSEGWYRQRRPLQAVLVVGVAVGAVAVGVAGAALLRGYARRCIPAFVGMAALLAYPFVQAVSLHQVDHVLAMSRGPLTLGRAVETAALCLVFAGALFSGAWRRRPRPPSRRPPSP